MECLHLWFMEDDSSDSLSKEDDTNCSTATATASTMSLIHEPIPLSSSSDGVGSDMSRSTINNGTTGEGGRAGSVSPQTIVQPRRLSTAIVTSAEDSSHEKYIQGRSTRLVVVPPAIEPGTSMQETEFSDHPPPSPHRRLSRPNSLRRYCSAPIENQAHEVLTVPPPLRLEAWAEPAADSFKVRGPYYLRNNKKIPSQESVFQLLTVDLVRTKKPVMGGICSLPNERIQLALKREQETGARELPEYLFVVNLVMPGDPAYHLVSYFGLDDIEVIKTNKTPFGRVARRFFFGSSDKFRDETFKLIPRIADGNFVVKKAVGTKPALLGTKVAQTYIRTDRFCEIMVDISSDTVAEKIVKLTLGYAKTVIVDMAFVLEGKREDELPEALLGAVQMRYVDFKDCDGQRVWAKAS